MRKNLSVGNIEHHNTNSQSWRMEKYAEILLWEVFIAKYKLTPVQALQKNLKSQRPSLWYVCPYSCYLFDAGSGFETREFFGTREGIWWMFLVVRCKYDPLLVPLMCIQALEDLLGQWGTRECWLMGLTTGLILLLYYLD